MGRVSGRILKIDNWAYDIAEGMLGKSLQRLLCCFITCFLAVRARSGSGLSHHFLVELFFGQVKVKFKH